MGQEILLHLKVHFQKVRVRSSVHALRNETTIYLGKNISENPTILCLEILLQAHPANVEEFIQGNLSKNSESLWHHRATTHSFLFPSPPPPVFSGSSTSGRCSRESRGLPLPLQSPRPRVERMFHSRRGKPSVCVTPLSWKLSSPGKCGKKEPGIFSPRPTHACRKKLYSRHDRPKILDPHDSHPSFLLAQGFHARSESREDLWLLSPSPTSF